MNGPVAKTLAEHVEFNRELAGLMLWFAAEQVRKNPDVSLSDILENQTGIGRLLVVKPEHSGANKWAVYASAEWRAIRDAWGRVLSETGDGPGSATRFETRALEVVADALDAVARASYVPGPPKSNGALGALSYETPKPENPRRVTFHITNPLQPRSIFDDPEYLPRCLLALMEDAEARWRATGLFTGTWLNSCPPFLRCFPAEYAESVPLCERYFLSRGAGTWGQFVNARGCFNAKYGDQLRRTGSLPFMPVRAWCSFAALRRHLTESFGVPAVG